MVTTTTKKIPAHKIYAELKKIKGVELDNWSSDLYVKVTPETRKVIERYEYPKSVTTFRSQIDKTLWYEIPFAYPSKMKTRKK